MDLREEFGQIALTVLELVFATLLEDFYTF
jgi:hypothetical protein